MVKRKDGRWQEALTVTVNGRPKRRYFYGRTKAEVLRKIAAAKDREENGPPMDAVISEWLPVYRQRVSPNTYRPASAAARRAADAFAGVPVSQLTPAMISRFVASVAATRHEAKKTAELQRCVVSLACAYAIEQGWITSNPARDAVMPRGLKSTPREMPSAEDIAHIKAGADLPGGMFALWALYTGLRRGELLALRWEDVDMASRTVRVSRSLIYDGKSAYVKSPKTAAGVRVVPLPDRLAEHLRPGRGPVFPGADGGYMPRGVANRMWDRFRAAAGVSCTPHQLRHAYATMLYEASVDGKEAQALLGHAQLSTTMDVYTHVREALQRRWSERLLGLDIE